MPAAAMFMLFFYLIYFLVIIAIASISSFFNMLFISLIPLAVALVKKQTKTGILGSVCCFVAYKILGVYAFYPVCIYFVCKIFDDAKNEETAAASLPIAE